MERKTLINVAATIVIGLVYVTNSAAAILGQHAFTWWDDPNAGLMVTPLNAAAPTAASVRLVDMEEWHIDQADTTAWYAGAAVPGLPMNPFNVANRTNSVSYPNGLIGAVTPVVGAEGFIYRMTNQVFFGGNAIPPAPPFSFEDPIPPGGTGGVNDLSGINIVDTHGALNTALPVPGSQFMFTATLPFGQVLDLTPGSLVQAHDWDFNAFSPGSFEWDIDAHHGSGITNGLGPGVFGFAMPGNWLDGVNDGWVHSWDNPTPAIPNSSLQVNVADPPGVVGFSGPIPINGGEPIVPEPSTVALLGLGGLLSLGFCGWRRRRR